MSEQDDVKLDTPIEPTEEVEKTDEVEVETPVEETEDLEALKEKNEKLFQRAKKAEAEAKLLKAERLKAEEKAKVTVPEKQGDLTAMDAIAFFNAKVTEQEDIQEVLDYAKFRKISVGEALKNSTVKTILSEKAELRKSAEVANTSSQRRVSQTISDETILRNAEKGVLPEDPEAFAQARMRQKLSRITSK